MHPKLLLALNRLEAMSLRERALLLAAVPVVLALVVEFGLVEPARNRAVVAAKQGQVLRKEVQELGAALAALPAASALPAADQLHKEREQLQAQLNASREVLDRVREVLAWGNVVRGAAEGTPGLRLMQMKTLAVEQVFSATQPQAPAGAAARTGGANAGLAAAVRASASANAGAGARAGRPSAAAGAAGAAAPLAMAAPAGFAEVVYRHRAELSVAGDFPAVAGYLARLQHLPGDLRWETLNLTVHSYPQATLQLLVYTLGTRAETPFD